MEKINFLELARQDIDLFEDDDSLAVYLAELLEKVYKLCPETRANIDKAAEQ